MTESTKEETFQERPEEMLVRDSATMGFLVRLAEELNSTLDLDTVLEKVAERVKPVVDYDTFGVLLLDPLGQYLTFRFGIGFSPDVLSQWRFGFGQGIVGTAAQTGRAVRVDDVRSDPRYINAMGEARSELAIPLIAKNQTIGVLDVQSRRPGHFSDCHQEILAFLAGHLANAIENARLYENLREQTRSLSLLHEAGRELTSILDLEPLMRKMAELVKRLVDYQVFSLMLWDEDQRLLLHGFSLKFDERFTNKTNFPLGYGITGTAAALRQAVRVPNVHLDARFVRCGHQVEVRSELAVPLVFKDRLIGVLDLESTEYNAFTERHEEMLSTMASYLAIAIENARLYKRVSQDERRLADDLATAREIQKGLLPDAAPLVPGLSVGFAYKPARMLGGDFYDFLPYGKGRLAVAVGDVAGKGAAAALQGSLAIGSLREHVVSHPCDPADMLGHMNHRLEQPRLDNRFVAMAFAVYDANEPNLTVANAGFPRPQLLRDGRVEEIPVQGLPLGILPEPTYEQRKLDLRDGDVVVLCSDGLKECIDRDGEEFGTERLELRLIELSRSTAQEIADGLLEATAAHAGANGEPQDDRTIVVLKVGRH
jgi:sigma-B regulation protein RsbU (phosphoserine phosphatase)